MWLILTRFQDGWNTHCLPMRIGRSQNLAGVKRANFLGNIASYWLTSVSSKRFRIYVVDWVPTKLVLPHFILSHKNFWNSTTERQDILDHWIELNWIYCAIFSQYYRYGKFRRTKYSGCGQFTVSHKCKNRVKVNNRWVMISKLSYNTIMPVPENRLIF